MTAAGEQRDAGLGDELRRMLADPPVTEKKLLELDVAWPGLTGAQARTAAQLRVFVITWDPLERLGARPEGFATVNVDPDGTELVVYLPVWSLVDTARTQHTTVSAVVAAMAGSVVVAAAARAAQSPVDAGPPSRKGRRAGPANDAELLDHLSAGAALGTPSIRPHTPGWEDIGLGAITDVVQHAFGPVDLDRSLVVLPPLPQRVAGCPACAGRHFGFPADLIEAQRVMCATHDAKAETVVRTRLARANASNPDGWEAITDASIRLSRPHLPGGLVTKLTGVPGMEAAARARLVVEATGWFPGRGPDFAMALADKPDLPDWLVELLVDLGRAGLDAEAAAIGDALATVDPALRRTFDGDAAVGLARAGLAAQALARVADNLSRWPGDGWILVRAGDALLVLGDRDGARERFRAALDLAGDDDIAGRSDALLRLSRLERLDLPLRRVSKPEPGSRPTTRGNGKADRARSRRKRGR